MEPRILSRTHYQVDEPTLIHAVTLRCSSPVASSYGDTVAQRLSSHVRAGGKRFNVAAAKYAVDLARKLAVVNANNVWVDNGHLINLVARVGPVTWPDELELNLAEKLLHFRLFLEADGAAMVFLARLLVSNGQLPFSGSDWNAVASSMFVQVYSDYLSHSTVMADRVTLRSKIDRIKSHRYKGKSGAHKMFLHLQVLYRLGLVERSDDSNERCYRVTDAGRERLVGLVTALSDVLELERHLNEHRHIELAAQILGIRANKVDLSPSDSLNNVVPAYKQVVETGVAICPLAPVLEATQISLLTNKAKLVGYVDLVEGLRKAQSIYPREVRFHQDRSGAAAFLTLSDDLVRQFTVVDN